MFISIKASLPLPTPLHYVYYTANCFIILDCRGQTNFSCEWRQETTEKKERCWTPCALLHLFPLYFPLSLPPTLLTSLPLSPSSSFFLSLLHLLLYMYNVCVILLCVLQINGFVIIHNSTTDDKQTSSGGGKAPLSSPFVFFLCLSYTYLFVYVLPIFSLFCLYSNCRRKINPYSRWTTATWGTPWR